MADEARKPGKPTNEARIKKLEEALASRPAASNGSAGLGIHEMVVYLATFATLFRTGRVSDLRDLPGEVGKLEDIVTAAMERRDEKPLIDQINGLREKGKRSAERIQELETKVVDVSNERDMLRKRMEQIGPLPV